jgi:hypothetical protein
MDKVLRFTQKNNGDCLNWDELEFVKYSLDELSPSERAKFEEHIGLCEYCRESFLLCWDMVINDSEEDAEKDLKFLFSPLWQQQKQELARVHSRAVNAHISLEDSTKQQQMPHASKPRVRRNEMSLLKMAAMLFVMLSSIALTYNLLIKPLSDYKGNKEALSRLAVSEDDLTGELAKKAEYFEKANARLVSDPKDLDALKERAAGLEKFYLFEHAKSDYELYLSLETDPTNRNKIGIQYKDLLGQLDTPAAKATLYDRLNDEIDRYLRTSGGDSRSGVAGNLDTAASIATEMESRAGERFGSDIVAYYRKLSADTLAPLKVARSLRPIFDDLMRENRFPDALQAIEKQRMIFKNYAAECELEQTEIQFLRYLTKTNSLDMAKDLFEPNIKRTAASRHLFLQAQFHLYQGTYFNSISDLENSRRALETAIEIASRLEVPRFLTNPMVTLAAMYQSSNKNGRAFELAYESMKTARETNDNFRLMQLMQALGISAFNLKYPSLAEYYIDSSIAFAEKNNDPRAIALSHAYSGIIRMEQHRIADADYAFGEAISAIERINDTKIRATYDFYVTGYYARSQMLAGNVSRAVDLYRRARELGQAANIQQKLFLSQIHQGLGECLMAQGDFKGAELELSIATNLDLQARARFETNNNLLTFAISHKSSQELIDLINQKK